MARLIPENYDAFISQSAERLVYKTLERLPDPYVVKFSQDYAKAGPRGVNVPYEMDFVIYHPQRGLVVVEVKDGPVRYQDGLWWRPLDGVDTPLRPDPVEQARNAMFDLRDQFRELAGFDFPLPYTYAVCFPRAQALRGQLPPGMSHEQLWLESDLDHLEERLSALLPEAAPPAPRKTDEIMMRQILNPTLTLFPLMADELRAVDTHIERITTEEQERILDAIEANPEMRYYGKAGTGKTFVAMELAKRLAGREKKVLLTWYNRQLRSAVNALEANAGITAEPFLDYLQEILAGDGRISPVLPDDPALQTAHYESLPSLARQFFLERDDDTKFDAILVDEAQDFDRSWVDCLRAMLRPNGHFHVFADPEQNVYRRDISYLDELPAFTYRLNRNFRNSKEIQRYLQRLHDGEPALEDGFDPARIRHLPWRHAKEERSLLEREISRLLKSGIKGHQIAILSIERREQSCLAGVDAIKSYAIVEKTAPKENELLFSTIRTFKGLEAPVIFLIGVDAKSPRYSLSDFHTGASRARFALFVLHRDGWQPTLTRRET